MLCLFHLHLVQITCGREQITQSRYSLVAVTHMVLTHISKAKDSSEKKREIDTFFYSYTFTLFEKVM